MITTKEINSFHAKGRYVAARNAKTDGFVIVTIVVKDPFRDIYPEIRCPKSMIERLSNHSFVEVDGYIVSERSGGRDVPRIYATDIRPAKTLLEKEFGVKGRFWEAEDCFYKLTGIVADVVEDDLKKNVYMRYTVRTQNPETEEHTEVRIDWKKIDRHPEFLAGDYVCAVCKVNTPKKPIGTETRIFLNLDVFDMQKIPSGE